MEDYNSETPVMKIARQMNERNTTLLKDVKSIHKLPNYMCCFPALIERVTFIAATGNYVYSVRIGSFKNIPRFELTITNEGRPYSIKYWEASADGKTLTYLPALAMPKDPSLAWSPATGQLERVTFGAGELMSFFCDTPPLENCIGTYVMVINMQPKVGKHLTDEERLQHKMKLNKRKDGTDYALETGGADPYATPGGELKINASEILTFTISGFLPQQYLTSIGYNKNRRLPYCASCTELESASPLNNFNFTLYCGQESRVGYLNRVVGEDPTDKNVYTVKDLGSFCTATLREATMANTTELGPFLFQAKEKDKTTGEQYKNPCLKLDFLVQDPAVSDATPYSKVLQTMNFATSVCVRMMIWSNIISAACDVDGDVMWGAIGRRLIEPVPIVVSASLNAGDSASYPPSSAAHSSRILVFNVKRVMIDVPCALAIGGLFATPRVAEAIIKKSAKYADETGKPSNVRLTGPHSVVIGDFFKESFMDNESIIYEPLKRYQNAMTEAQLAGSEFSVKSLGKPFVCVSCIGVLNQANKGASTGPRYIPLDKLVQSQCFELQNLANKGYLFVVLYDNLDETKVAEMCGDSDDVPASRTAPINLGRQLLVSTAYTLGGEAYEYKGVQFGDKKSLLKTCIHRQFSLTNNVACVFAVRPDIANFMIEHHGTCPTAEDGESYENAMDDSQLDADACIFKYGARYKASGYPDVPASIAAVASDVANATASSSAVPCAPVNVSSAVPQPTIAAPAASAGTAPAVAAAAPVDANKCAAQGECLADEDLLLAGTGDQTASGDEDDKSKDSAPSSPEKKTRAPPIAISQQAAADESDAFMPSAKRGKPGRR